MGAVRRPSQQCALVERQRRGEMVPRVPRRRAHLAAQAPTVHATQAAVEDVHRASLGLAGHLGQRRTHDDGVALDVDGRSKPIAGDPVGRREDRHRPPGLGTVLVAGIDVGCAQLRVRLRHACHQRQAIQRQRGAKLIPGHPIGRCEHLHAPPGLVPAGVPRVDVDRAAIRKRTVIRLRSAYGEPIVGKGQGSPEVIPAQAVGVRDRLDLAPRVGPAGVSLEQVDRAPLSSASYTGIGSTNSQPIVVEGHRAAEAIAGRAHRGRDLRDQPPLIRAILMLPEDVDGAWLGYGTRHRRRADGQGVACGCQSVAELRVSLTIEGGQLLRQARQQRIDGDGVARLSRFHRHGKDALPFRRQARRQRAPVSIGDVQIGIAQHDLTGRVAEEYRLAVVRGDGFQRRRQRHPQADGGVAASYGRLLERETLLDAARVTRVPLPQARSPLHAHPAGSLGRRRRVRHILHLVASAVLGEGQRPGPALFVRRDAHTFLGDGRGPGVGSIVMDENTIGLVPRRPLVRFLDLIADRGPSRRSDATRR